MSLPDKDGDGIPDDQDNDLCDSSSIQLEGGALFSGIGNTTLSTTAFIDTEASGEIIVQAPHALILKSSSHALILKSSSVRINSGIGFSVENGGLFSIVSQADVCGSP